MLSVANNFAGRHSVGDLDGEVFGAMAMTRVQSKADAICINVVPEEESDKRSR